MPRKKRKIAVIDAETDPFKHGRTPKPFAWGFYDGTHYVSFWGNNSTNDLIDYLSTEDEPLIIYAHNGGKFDFFFLLEWLDPDMFIINGRISKATLFDGLIELRDSWLILPLPLASHDKNEIDYNKMERNKRDNYKTEIMEYLRKDCTSLYDWVTNFINSFGNNLTLASSAFKQLRKLGYDIKKTYTEFDNRYREFYYGGRVQCLEVGSFYQSLKYIDIRSAYPYAMTFNHWYGHQAIEQDDIPDTSNGSWFADIDAISKGALPFRWNNKLYFPDDNIVRNYKVTGWEVITGLKNNRLKIKSVNKVYRPLLTENFKNYVSQFFKMKDEADLRMKECDLKNDVIGSRYYKAQRTFAKFMLNSCYGKFGQDGRKFEKFKIKDYGEFPSDDYDWKVYTHLDVIDKSIYHRPDPVNSFFNVATAASITGFVRAKLFDAICSSTRPLYCDTDSLVCIDADVDYSDKLGAWEVEAELKEIHIAQRKMYAAKTVKGEYKLAHKGVNLGKRSEMSTQKKIYKLIVDGIKSGDSVEIILDAPAYNLRLGAIDPRFFKRSVDFSNLHFNAISNPEDLEFEIAKKLIYNN